MGRKSSIERSEENVRATIDGLIRKGRFTLEEIRAYVRNKHGPEHTPSRSALGRYSQAQEALLERMRDIDAAARVVVEELGESPDDRAGGLLVQSITTLATDAALRAQVEGSEISIEEVRKLARAAKDVISARSMSLKERVAIERLAREKLHEEQSANLDKVAAEQGMDEVQVKFWRERFLGISG